MPKTHTREEWLRSFVSHALPLINKRTGLSLTKPVEISVGFPTTGGKRRKNGTITTGQCLFHPNHKHHHIFIHPLRSVKDQEEVGETIFHELLHASLPPEAGHRRPFSQAAKKLGLVGKPTMTELSDELRERVQEIIGQIGYDYPHEDSVEVDTKPQTARLLKVMCPICGYVCRVTAKWLDEAGTPICPTDNLAMEEAGVGDEAAAPLTVRSQVVEYQVRRLQSQITEAAKAGLKLGKFDERFFIQMRRNGGEIEWSVIDYGPAVVGGKVVLGDVAPAPRHYHADNKADAIALVEGLQSGMDPKDAADVEDIDVTAIDDDPDLDNFDDIDYDDGDDTFDFEEDDADPRFQWEKDKGIPVESINPDDEADRREGWVDR